MDVLHGSRCKGNIRGNIDPDTVSVPLSRTNWESLSPRTLLWSLDLDVNFPLLRLGGRGRQGVPATVESVSQRSRRPMYGGWGVIETEKV